MFTANAMPAFTKVGLGRGRKWYMIYFKDHFPSRKLAVILRLLLEGSSFSGDKSADIEQKRREREKERQAALTLRSFLSLLFFYLVFLSTWSSSSVVTTRKLGMKSLCFYYQQDQFYSIKDTNKGGFSGGSLCCL